MIMSPRRFLARLFLKLLATLVPILMSLQADLPLHCMSAAALSPWASLAIILEEIPPAPRAHFSF